MSCYGRIHNNFFHVLTESLSDKNSFKISEFFKVDVELFGRNLEKTFKVSLSFFCQFLVVFAFHVLLKSCFLVVFLFNVAAFVWVKVSEVFQDVLSFVLWFAFFCLGFDLGFLGFFFGFCLVGFCWLFFGRSCLVGFHGLGLFGFFLGLGFLGLGFGF